MNINKPFIVATRTEQHSAKDAEFLFDSFAWRKVVERVEKAISDYQSRLETANTPYEIAQIQGAIRELRTFKGLPDKITEEMRGK